MAEAKKIRAASDGPTTNDLSCRWYIAYGGVTEGPLDYRALVARAKAGELGRYHHVWRPGFEAWIPVAARPDLARFRPARPTLGLVPDSLEAAQAQETEELFFSQDVVSVDDARESEDMIYAGATTTEDRALEALELKRREPPPPPPTGDLDGVPTLPSYETQEETSSAIERVASLVDHTPAPAAALGATDLDEEDLARVVGRGPKRWILALVLLLIVAAGLGFAKWDLSGILPRLIKPGAAPVSPGSTDDAAPRYPRLSRPRSALFISQRIVGPRAELDSATPRAVREKRARVAQRKAAGAGSENLAWLNRSEADAKPAPEPERPAPRRFRVEAPEREIEIEAPSALPSDLSDAAVGPVISASLGRLARCGRLDRVGLEVPPGTELLISVRSDGSVARTRTRGAPGPVASCLARAARRLSFPAFQKPEARIQIRFARAGTVRAEVQAD